ncbi:PQQ-binding-like beta-propeller repeat protein [Candidatus Poribacteria bacterium]
MKAIIIVSMSILFCFLATTSFAADWPQWRGPSRDGVSSETGWSSSWPEDGPKQAWKLSVGIGYSSVAVSDGRVYTMGNVDKTDTIYCLNADTGAEIWKHSYACTAEGNGYPGPASTPTVDGGFVYTLSREGHVHCLKAESGDVVWSKHVVEDFGVTSPEWSFASSALVLGEKLILDTGMALALDKSTGELLWKTKDYGDAWKDTKNHPQGGGYSSAVAFNLDGSERVAVLNSTGLVILDPGNGQELMLHPWETPWNVNAATPLISGNEVFIASSDSGGALIQITEDKLVSVWQSKEMKNHLNSSVLWEGYLYGFDESQLSCLDWKTGEVKWTQKDLGKGSLMLADGKLIALSDNGNLVIAEASPDGFKELASAKILSGLCWTVPVLANGKIYCRNHPGDLVCIDVKP